MAVVASTTLVASLLSITSAVITPVAAYAAPADASVSSVAAGPVASPRIVPSALVAADGVAFNTDVSVPTRLETVWVDSDADGFLNAWIDFNRNGSYDASERIANDTPVVAGTNQITYTVPTGASFVAGDSSARFDIVATAGQVTDPGGVVNASDHPRQLFDAPSEALGLCVAGTRPVPVSLIQNPSFEDRTGDFSNGTSSASTIGYAESWSDSHPTGGQYHVFSPDLDSGPVEGTMPVRAGADGYAFEGGHSNRGNGEGAVNVLAASLNPDASYVGFFSMAAGGSLRGGNGFMQFFGTNDLASGSVPHADVTPQTPANTELLYSTPVVDYAGNGVRPTWELNTFQLDASQAWPYLRVEIRNETLDSDHTTGGQAWMNFDDFHMYECEPIQDFGDAPASYGTSLEDDGPRHLLPGYDEDSTTALLMLGSLVDEEEDGFASADALGDDENASADEDGVSSPIIVNGRAETDVTVTATNNTDAAATIAGWIDLDGNGTFDTGELVTVAVPANSGTADYVLTFPIGTVTEDTFARFRLFPSDVTEFLPTGAASAGEVEDYAVTFTESELGIEKTSSMTTDSRPGDTVEYAVTATNTGTGPFTTGNPAVIFDDLAGVLDDAEYNGDAVAVASDGSAVSDPAFLDPSFLSWSGPLAAGEWVTITYTVTLAAGGDGTVRNVAWQPVTPPPPTVPPVDIPACDPATADGTDPVTGEPCAATEGLLPKLTVEKSSDVTDLPADGGEVTYTVTVTNEGPGVYTEDAPATVTDDLSEVLDDAVFGEITAPADGAVFDEDAQELTWSGPLGVDESVEITYTVTYDSTTGDKILYNVACVPADHAATAGADCADVRIPAAALEITKSADPADGTRVFAGQDVTYTVSFASIGETAAAVDVIDDLSNVFDDATLVEGSIVTSDPALTATLNGEQLAIAGLVPAGETFTVSYTVTVNAYAEQGNHNLGNVVTNSDGTCQVDGCPETEHPVRHLSLTKSADSTEGVRTGDTVEYTVIVTNDGEAAYTVADPAVITDDMSGVLDDATYNGDAVAVASDGSEVPAPSYLSPLLGWSGPLAVGESVAITYTVTVTNLGDHEMINTASIVCADGEICEPPVVVDVDLPYITPAKVSDPATGEAVSAGDVVTYTLSWTNSGLATGPVDSTDDLSDVLDDGEITSDPVVDEAHADAITANLNLDAQTIRVTGDLAPGETATVTYQVTIGADGDRGNNIAGNVLTPDLPTYVCEEGNEECVPPPPPETVHLIDELRMDKSVDPESGTNVYAGQQVTYTLSFEAIGQAPSAVDALDNLSDVLDDATLVDGSIVTSNEALTATLDGAELRITGEVPAGETYTVSYTVIVNAFADQADHVLGNVLSNADGTCGVDDCYPTENPIPHINVTKSADSTTDVETGDTVTYTVIVTNDGEGDYTTEAPAAVTDDMTDVLDDAAYNGDAVAVASDGSAVPAPEFAAPNLTWSGPLAAGESVTITYSVLVTNLGDHDMINTASVVCAEAETCGPPVVVVVPLPSITPAKVSDPATGEAVSAGDVVTYTLSWTNSGLATGPVDSTDDLSDVLDDGEITSDPVVDEAHADAITANLNLDAQTIRVTGDLAPGETATVTYQVTIGADGDRGNNIAGNVLTPDVPPYVCEEEAAECDPFVPPTTEHPIGELDDWKTVDPASGSTVQAGQVVTYTLSFENTGEAPVAVNRDDVLTQVLDDVTVTTAPVSSDAALTVSEITDGRFNVFGSLEPGQLVTVTYTVTVNADGARGDDRLGNFLVNTGEMPSAECVPADGERADCTINHVSDVVVSKSSDPASGTEVAQGENVTYTLTFENVSTNADAADVSIDYTDHMVDVLDDATLQAGPTSSDEAVTAVTDGDTIRITGAVASGDTVTVTYTVTVKAYDQQGNHTLGNVVAITGEEPVCAPDSTLCTTHDLPKPPPLAATGGEITLWVLATALMLLAGGGALMIARRRRAEENVEDQLIS
ncbi:GEVED domain-containing protein [Microbacterium sp. A84]|uniref:DUF7927 domain-containing protein n=1 Tax=Microbacterium sp. A84 TaxID=3450715 RepID=UPI003F4255E3